MDKVKVSVIIYVLNDISYVERCLRSVMDQTLQEIEILIIDGGSTDGTLEVIKKLAAFDSRIRLIHSTPGVGHQFNVGLQEATGEYIGICESDDYILPNMYEKQYSIAQKYHLDVIRADKQCFCEVDGKEVFFQETIHIVGLDRFYDTVIDPRENMCFIQLGSLGIWSGIYRRGFLLEQKLFMNETQGASYQDTSFAFMVAVKAERAMILKDAFYCYRVDNPDSSSNSPQGIRRMVDEYSLLKKRLKEAGVFDKYKEYYLPWKIYACLWFYDLLKEEQKKDYIPILYEDLHEDIKDADYQAKGVTVRREKDIIEAAKHSFDKFSEFMERDNVRFCEMKEKINQIGSDGKVIIFGYGNVGKLVYQHMCYSGKNTVAYVDNNEALWGTVSDGVEVMAPQQAVNTYPDGIYVVANVNHYEDIKEQLENLGINESNIIICNNYDIFLRKVLIRALQEKGRYVR